MCLLCRSLGNIHLTWMGGYGFLGEKISVGKFDWKKISVSGMDRKKYSVSTSCLKNIVFVEKNNVPKKKNSAALRSEKI